MKITKARLRQILQEEKALLESEERESEMREFSRSRSGKKVMQAGSKIRSAAGVISEVAEDQTGSMRKTLYGISEFVEKLGSSLSEIGMLEEGSSATSSLPTIQELRQLHKNIQKLEKYNDNHAQTAETDHQGRDSKHSCRSSHERAE